MIHTYTARQSRTRAIIWWAAMTIALVVVVTPWAPAKAQDEPAQPSPRISVSGTGKTEIAPDMAMISMSVRTESKTARAALDENNVSVADVIAALTSEGIAARDMQTSGFSINPRITYPGQNNRLEAPRTVGYTVQNTVTVRIRDLSRVGSVLDKSVSLGVNRGGSLTFTNSEPEQAIEAARIAAMGKAMAKANTLAKAAGVQLGKIISISERSSRSRPVSMMRSAMAASPARDAVPVAAGENSYSVTVNAVWAIEQ